MPTPNIRIYQISGINGSDDISRINIVGGPVGREVSTTPGSDDINWGRHRAGEWGQPICLAFMFQGETIDSIGIKMTDYVSSIDGGGIESFYGTGQPNGDGSGPSQRQDWDIRVGVSPDYIDFRTQSDQVRVGTIESWDHIHRGVNIASKQLKEEIVSGVTGGNQRDNAIVSQGRNFIVPHDTIPQTWMYNSYVYLAARPEPNALPGRHRAWSISFDYDFPIEVDDAT